MKVLDGRPLMYYYLNTSNKKQNMILVADEIKYYRAYCTSLGLKEPFAVVMNITGSETSSIFGDAASRYSFSGTSDQTFESFINGVQRTYEGYQKAGFQYVPPTTFGWHAEPRYKNPVSWMNVNENSWVPYPTEEEMYNHISYALSYLDHPSAEMFTKANTLIFYAWNEHDEGSWLCPTLKVDADGNQLYNEDGSKMIDDSRVKILKKALDDFESGKRVEVFINGLSNFDASLNATPTPTPTDENSGTTNNNSFNPIFIIIPVGAAVIIAGTVTAVIIIKKKKSEK